MTPAPTISGYHRAFLAPPCPLSKTLIGREPIFYLEHTLKSCAGLRDLSRFAAEALAHYRALLKELARLHADIAQILLG